MKLHSRKAWNACALAAVGLIYGSAAALADADLIINVEDSTVNAGSCSTSEPLATGRIAIKNQGEDKAALSVTERFARSMLAVYVPENIDMIAKKTKREALDPFDQEGIAFSLGEGVVKKGRHFGEPDSRSYRRTTRPGSGATGAGRVRVIQQALTKLGFDTEGVDGVIGSNTRAAIREFQRDQGEAVTGTLTDSQTATLMRLSGLSVSSSSTSTGVYGAQGPVTIRLYAVVDPYNLVEETNEANNIQEFSIRIDCSN